MVSLVVTQNEYHTSLLVPLLSVFLCSIQLVLFCYYFVISFISHLAFTCPKSAMKTLEVWNFFTVVNKNTRKRHWRQFSVFIVNFVHISRLFLVFPLLALNKYLLTGTTASSKSLAITQPVFICSKSTVETPEQCVKSIKVNNKDNRTASVT